jgi:two-component system sensor histidine kinase KdpD
VLANLLSNAYKFSPPESPVTITVSEHEGRVEISVTDQGPGVPEQRRGELFQKFSRLGAEGAGMGLGLFISRAIARAHGGDLLMSTAAGTVFTISLPRHVHEVRV